MKLADMTCTHCEGAGLELQAEGAVVCRYCGTPNQVEGVVCPRCEAVNAPGAAVCADCRQSLVKSCPACSTQNWAGAERCRHCGRGLDAVAHVINHWDTNPANRLNEQMRANAELKKQQLADGERRTADFAAIEQRRLAQVAEARKRRDAQQRMWSIGLAVALTVFIVFVAVILYAAYVSK